MVDARTPEEYAAAHIPGSVYLGLDPGLPTWLGWLFPPEKRIVAVVEDAAQAHAYYTWLVRVGYDNLIGYLPEGVARWRKAGKPLRSLRLAAPDEARRAVEAGRLLVDVRTPREFAGGSLPEARSLPLCELPGRLGEIARDACVTLMCQGGYRGTIAASLLLNAGYPNVENVVGGYGACACAAKEPVGPPEAQRAGVSNQ